MNILQNIIKGNGIENILITTVGNIFNNGACKNSDMEILSLIKRYHPELFCRYEKEIITYMGLFYKNVKAENLKQLIFTSLADNIKDTLRYQYTPVQASLALGIEEYKNFSFSAPTSTGKSYVFINIIKDSQKDVAVIVPSRALINEYLEKIRTEIKTNEINVLPFVDKINTSKAKRTVFVLTPERARMLFANKDIFDIEYILFDEAQLGDEKGKRGIYFDSIIRRCKKNFPNSKFVFAHPFISNPESQLNRNDFDLELSNSIPYNHKNVGQTYMCCDFSKKEFYHFLLDKELANQKEKCAFDPLMTTLERGGCILVFTSNTSITSGAILENFAPYIKICNNIEDERLDGIIAELREYLGCSIERNRNFYSNFVANLKKGILLHHGSLPLYVRQLVEKIANMHLCRICFATSTLEQGINMPFDLVYVDRLESSKPLGVKNLIGRAGRSTTEERFDYGIVLLGSVSQMSKFRNLMNNDSKLGEESLLDITEEDEDAEIKDFKESINNETFSDQYNMTPQQLAHITEEQSINTDIENALNCIDFDNIKKEIRDKSYILFIESFNNIYTKYLGRPLVNQEKNILRTALEIMIERFKSNSFKAICQRRFTKATKGKRNANYNNLGIPQQANFVVGYDDLPNKYIQVHSLFPKGTTVDAVSYDAIVYDTYDYIDKLIEFRLSDIYFATFHQYYERTRDERAQKMCKLIQYGTIDEKKIWMLRYGMSFEDIDRIGDYIIEINEQHIKVSDSFNDLPDSQRICIEHYL